MKYLYLDNFRGFSDTIIPFRDVNFLVGENSSGKTSVLSILKIISSHKIWMSGGFNEDTIELGNFEDLVSNESNRLDEFSLGYMDHSEKNGKISAFIISYSNSDGIPNPRKVTYSDNKNIIHAVISNNLEYSVCPISQVQSKKSASINFKKFKEKHFNWNNELKAAEIPKEVKLTPNIPLLIIQDIIFNNLKKKKSTFRISVDLTDNREIVWLSPIRAEPKRSYDNLQYGFSPDGKHIPFLLNTILGNEKATGTELHKALEKFGIESGLFKAIRPNRYGDNKSSPFELGVVLVNKPLKISSVGYGVSQVLPIIVESFLQRKGSVFSIQQPEVHLHPKAQAALGGFFYDLADNENKQFFIETHSDFLIDRFRLRLKQAKKKKIRSQILYFERTSKGNKCTSIDINNEGQYSVEERDALTSYRGFFINEQTKLLEI